MLAEMRGKYGRENALGRKMLAENAQITATNAPANNAKFEFDGGCAGNGWLVGTDGRVVYASLRA